MRKGEKHHKWKLCELCFIRDNTWKYTDGELGERLGGLTKAQIRGARIMYGIGRRKKQNRPPIKRVKKPIGTIITRKVFGENVKYIKTEYGWTTLHRHKQWH
jgi:hypothetical protein